MRAKPETHTGTTRLLFVWSRYWGDSSYFRKVDSPAIHMVESIVKLATLTDAFSKIQGCK